ncbi:MAG: PEP-CTERM sorting domain-containing protein [Planctomycetota bacterium]
MKRHSKSLLLTAIIGTTAAGLCTSTAAETIVLDQESLARVASGSTNSRDDNNGGDDFSRLIGLNTGGLDNLLIYRFDLSSLAGLTATADATLEIDINGNFTNGNHGTTDDQIAAHELFLTNAGWVKGTGTIGANDNLTDDGSVSFLNFAQYNDDPGPASGTSVPWKDAGGADVSDLRGAISAPLDTVPGYNQGTGNVIGSLSFTIDQSTVQGWIDNGLAGIVVTAIDDGDSKSRFFLQSGTLTVDAVPEPGSLACLALGGVLIARRRR